MQFPSLQLAGSEFWIAALLALGVAAGILALVHFANNQVKRAVIVGCAFLAGLFYFLEFFIPPDLKSEEVIVLRWNLTQTGSIIGNAAQVIAGFTFLLGIYNLVHIHGNIIRRLRGGWINSVAFFAAFLAMVVFAFWRDWQNWFDPLYPNYITPGKPEFIDPKGATFASQVADKLWAPLWVNDIVKDHKPRQDVYTLLFEGVYRNMDATMFSILAFYIVSAAYRAFRIRTREAAVLMITAVIVMLGQVPLGQFLTNWIPADGFFHGLRLEEINQFVLGQINSPVQRAIGFGIGLGGLAMALRIWLSLERGSYFEEGS